MHDNSHPFDDYRTATETAVNATDRLFRQLT